VSDDGKVLASSAPTSDSIDGINMENPRDRECGQAQVYHLTEGAPKVWVPKGDPFLGERSTASIGKVNMQMSSDGHTIALSGAIQLNVYEWDESNEVWVERFVLPGDRKISFENGGNTLGDTFFNGIMPSKNVHCPNSLLSISSWLNKY
jgi:hypothetical protein